MNATDPLANLRDIHLPDALSAWPPAPGWWILAFLIIAMFCWTGWKLWQRHKQRFLLRFTLNKITELETAYLEHQNSVLLLRQYSTLIRRVCLARFSRQKVASLTGNQWLDFLNQTTDKEFFDNDSGQLLINAPYMKDSSITSNIDQLTENLKSWIQAVNQPQKESKDPSINSGESTDD